ncbi:MAG: YicC family protein [Oscillospiraceae bacterium]|nr:YicC family protein [Oscillospiraceae bacterium]
MIVSMTGYGRAQRTEGTIGITVELRAVNNRYFDCSVRSPRLFAYLEEPVRARVQNTVLRGKVDVYITLELTGEVEISLNRPIAEEYIRALRMLSADYGLRDDISVTALARLPDIFTMKKKEADAEELIEEVCAATDEALAVFSSMRAVEGENLARDILASLSRMEELVEKVEERSPQTMEEYRERLLERMKEVLDGVGVEESRILTEAALYADRVSVSEETVRLRSHIEQIRVLLADGGTVGRRLDFLVQECNREANTIGSKTHDTELAIVVVGLKSEIEKIREQAQNIM